MVQDFLNLAFNDKRPAEAFAEHVGPDYVQRDPDAPDGAEASARHLAGFVARFPELSLDIKRVIAEDDLVVTHCLMRLTPDSRGSAVADIMRVADGRTVEHWDVVPDLLENPANGDTMF
ncbi:nuclear transport factor 2 family protein [Allokutzneria oryzae]|uniref:Nuclear transport factor 2 family protein n=1 Tax=Allokutzneria oryzae TaxID=1378989 RepID=A0ABV5ZXQ4_9PSEU